ASAMRRNVRLRDLSDDPRGLGKIHDPDGSNRMPEDRRRTLTPMHRRVMSGVALLGVLALAGCGGSSPQAAAPSPTPTTASPTPTPTKSPTPRPTPPKATAKPKAVAPQPTTKPT